ncbi:MAG: hypothetical protein LBT83_00320 [Tannerella sp.]|jgi:hypothetical protein|nr:hypothetical protein [Tannerella sp.]
MIKSSIILFTAILCFSACSQRQAGVVPVVPPDTEINRSFGNHDAKLFANPPAVYHPETWFHFIGGNVSKEGITTDLEAIASAGISGIQLFHGQFGGPWPGMDKQITCLSPSWDDAVKHTAEECRRLGLRFTMQNCPGWAMSGGPWVEPSNAMRHLVYSRTDVAGGAVDMTLPLPQPSDEDWRDYKDVAIIAFPTPVGDTGEPLRPQQAKSSENLPWKDFISGVSKDPLHFDPVAQDNPHRVEVTFPEPTALRTIEFSSVQSFNNGRCYEPGVKVNVQALFPDGKTADVLNADIPWGSWQDDRPLSLACNEVKNVRTYRISFSNRHDMLLFSLRLYSAARKNNWETEAGWCLRGLERAGENPEQSPETFVNSKNILDISNEMDASGKLQWTAPEGNWSILRIGHVNTGMQNAPAPPEGTGWECDKLSEAGPNAHFAGYIGRIADGPLAGGLLNGLLLDSWECKTQTWTDNMEAGFSDRNGYPLRLWLPAMFGYVVSDHETTTRFLLDWRATIGDLFVNRFYGRMTELAAEKGMSVAYETSAGDVFPADILEYYKYADVPMCEFWQPFSDTYVGALNFKPVKPTASAARLYGKPRVAAEAFTSFSLTWDEHLSMLKEVNNVKAVEGVTHQVFHTYTHNPQKPFLPPGTSFGSGIGTPFLRGQTWWKHVPEFVACLSRCNYLLERGKPVSDVLWYLGDEINYHPDQYAPFPAGFKYDYCNPDILLNRLSVRNGKIVSPEGIEYSVLWLPDNLRMLPETLEKLLSLLNDGAIVVGNAPKGLATLVAGDKSQQRFDKAVASIWGNAKQESHSVGKGVLLTGIGIDEALRNLRLSPDVVGGNALWLHRRTEGADWYFVSAPQGSGFKGELSFRCKGNTELWDPVTGEITPLTTRIDGERSIVSLDLPQAGSCFVLFRHNGQTVSASAARKMEEFASKPLTGVWKLAFPSGWDVPESLEITELKAWKELDLSSEGKAFSGTATYTTTFQLDEVKPEVNFTLDLGSVEMIATVSLNGKPLRTLWTPPYSLDLGDAVKKGENHLTIEVTGTWFNRLVYDAGQPEEKRKTWTINAPSKDAPLRESGLLGPVRLISKK